MTISNFAKQYVYPNLPVFVIGLALLALQNMVPIYNWLSKPNHHFVYDAQFYPNPIQEWNQAIKAILEVNDFADNRLLQEIGNQIYDSIPIMASSSGIKPFEIFEIRIRPLGDTILKSAKIIIEGCRGFNSFVTYPRGGKQEQPDPNDAMKDRELVFTLPRFEGSRYDFRGGWISRRLGSELTVYAQDAENCRVVDVQVLTYDDKPATGVEDHDFTRTNTVEWEKYRRSHALSQIADLVTQILVIILLVYCVRIWHKLKSTKPYSIEQGPG